MGCCASTSKSKNKNNNGNQGRRKRKQRSDDRDATTARGATGALAGGKKRTKQPAAAAAAMGIGGASTDNDFSLISAGFNVQSDRLFDSGTAAATANGGGGGARAASPNGSAVTPPGAAKHHGSNGSAAAGAAPTRSPTTRSDVSGGGGGGGVARPQQRATPMTLLDFDNMPPPPPHVVEEIARRNTGNGAFAEFVPVHRNGSSADQIRSQDRSFTNTDGGDVSPPHGYSQRTLAPHRPSESLAQSSTGGSGGGGGGAVGGNENRKRSSGGTIAAAATAPGGSTTEHLTPTPPLDDAGRRRTSSGAGRQASIGNPLTAAQAPQHATTLPPIDPNNTEERRKWSVTHTGAAPRQSSLQHHQPLPPLGAGGGNGPPLTSPRTNSVDQFLHQTVAGANDPTLFSWASDQHTIPSSRVPGGGGSTTGSEADENGRKDSAVRSTPLAKPLTGILFVRNGVVVGGHAPPSGAPIPDHQGGGMDGQHTNAQNMSHAARTLRRLEAWVAKAVYGAAAEPVDTSPIPDVLYGVMTPAELAADEELERYIEETRFRLLLGGTANAMLMDTLQ